MSWDEVQAFAGHPNVKAFLRVIRNGESNQDDSAFTLLYGGSHFTSFDDHPRKRFPLPGGKYTTAAGAYQITEASWNDFTKAFRPMAFTPENQGYFVVWRLNYRKALDAVIDGRLDEAIRLLATEWTSLAIPKRQKEAPAIFQHFGGTLATTDTPVAPLAQTQEVKPMGAVLALLPSLIGLIPQLGQLFGSGSEVSNRNLAAAKVVADTVVQATQSANVQEAIEKMADPTVLQAAKDAVSELLPQLMDVGGGVESARKFAADHENSRYGRILEVVTYCAMFFLLLANGLSFAVGWFKSDWAQMSAIIQADIGSAIIAFGYFLGSSISSKRKDEVNGNQ